MLYYIRAQWKITTFDRLHSARHKVDCDVVRIRTNHALRTTRFVQRVPLASSPRVHLILFWAFLGRIGSYCPLGRWSLFQNQTLVEDA
jgi:hypothetical protein